jgi:glycosyltransferase involved in cell wall biosynthesis
MKFTIIVPTYNNVESIPRTVLSVINQTYEDWELIVVDDGSDDGTTEKLVWFADRLKGKMRIVKHASNMQRVVARNTGMKQAQGEWIIWLDADDMLFPYYLEVLDEATKKFPNAKVFNWGACLTWKNYKTTIRTSSKHNKGEIFKSGDVMSGGFMFKRECLELTGYLPEHRNPFDFGKAIKLDHPEIVPLYGDQNDLGNPWGDDWAMFYKLSRHFEPHWLEIAPYMVFVRTGNEKREL